MSRRALAAPFALALLAAPALAQQQGAPSDLHERPVPGTSGVTAVPGVGVQTDAGQGRGAVNHPNDFPTGTPGARVPSATGPLEGGGGPNGPSSPVPGQRSDAAPDARPFLLAQAEPQAPGAPPHPAATPGQADARVQQQLHDLYARLRITQAEMPQWNAFASTLQTNAQHMAELWAARPTGATVSALDDMRGYAQIAQAHAEDMQRLVGAFQPLYESLSPEQKAAADQAFRQAASRAGRPMPH